MRKLKEEREKQTAMEEKRRAAWNKRKLKGRRLAASDSGGESTQGLPPQKWGRLTPSPPGGRPPRAAPAAVGVRQGRPLGLS